MILNIGVFFDGASNNQDWVEPGQGQTQLQRHLVKPTGRQEIESVL